MYQTRVLVLVGAGLLKTIVQGAAWFRQIRSIILGCITMIVAVYILKATRADPKFQKTISTVFTKPHMHICLRIGFICMLMKEAVGFNLQTTGRRLKNIYRM